MRETRKEVLLGLSEGVRCSGLQSLLLASVAGILYLQTEGWYWISGKHIVHGTRIEQAHFAIEVRYRHIVAEPAPRRTRCITFSVPNIFRSHAIALLEHGNPK